MPSQFFGDRYLGGGNRTVLICQVTFCDHLFSSFVPSLMFIGFMQVKIFSVT